MILDMNQWSNIVSIYGNMYVVTYLQRPILLELLETPKAIQTTT